MRNLSKITDCSKINMCNKITVFQKSTKCVKMVSENIVSLKGIQLLLNTNELKIKFKKFRILISK